MTRVILTGFEPFDGARTNPSWDAVNLVARDWQSDVELLAFALPVEFETAADALLRMVDGEDPDAVIATGVAEGRAWVTPERIAINLADARLPDNAGRQPREQPIHPDGPAAYWSTLPVTDIVEAMRAHDIPARQSLSAGAYVCNDLFYRLQAAALPGAATGFIHVPASPQMRLGSDVPVLDTEVTARALRIAIDTTLAQHARNAPGA